MKIWNIDLIQDNPEIRVLSEESNGRFCTSYENEKADPMVIIGDEMFGLFRQYDDQSTLITSRIKVRKYRMINHKLSQVDLNYDKDTIILSHIQSTYLDSRC